MRLGGGSGGGVGVELVYFQTINMNQRLFIESFSLFIPRIFESIFVKMELNNIKVYCLEISTNLLRQIF